MGWDCTFHLVDPKLVSKAISLLVRGKGAPETFLAAYEEKGAAIWAEAQKRVMEESPEDAATLACQLGILVAASTHAHVYERGVALSFQYDPTARRCGPWIPSSLSSSPETMFKPLLKKRPELVGKFHTVIEHNSDTGVFISAGKVAKAAEAVRSSLFDSDNEFRDRYWGLYRVLRAAARHKLAFWEATDIGVASTNLDMLDAIREHCVWIPPEPEERSSFTCSVVSDVVFLHRYPYGGADEKRESVLVDTKIDPLTQKPSPGAFDRDASARLKSGVWITSALGGLVEYAGDGNAPGERTREIPCRVSGIVRACGKGAIIVPREDPPHFFDGKSTRPIDGLPAGIRKSKFGCWRYGMAATTFGNGNAALQWNAIGYEIDGKGSIVGDPWKLGITIPNSRNSICPWGEDGFYFADFSTVRRVRRGQSAETIVKLKDVIGRFQVGPVVDGETTVLVVHSRHLKKRTQTRTATLLFPETMQEIAIDIADFAASLSYAGGYFWGYARKDPAEYKSDHFFRVPESAVLALPKRPIKKPKR